MSTFIEGGVTAARGFSAAGIHCGIRKPEQKGPGPDFSPTGQRQRRRCIPGTWSRVLP